MSAEGKASRRLPSGGQMAVGHNERITTMKTTEKVGVGVLIAAILVALVFGAIALAPDSEDGGSLIGRNENTTPTAEVFCTYASMTNGSGLVALAESKPELARIKLAAEGYANGAPADIREPMARVVAGINRLDGPAPRTVDTDTTRAARQVDAWIAANCVGEGS